MGPDETELKLTESEIDSANLREITRLKTTNNEMRKKLDSLKIKVRVTYLVAYFFVPFVDRSYIWGFVFVLHWHVYSLYSGKQIKIDVGVCFCLTLPLVFSYTDQIDNVA
jgi:hypothetical protein